MIEKDQKHNVVSETGQTMRGGHVDDEGKHIVNHSVEELEETAKNTKEKAGE